MTTETPTDVQETPVQSQQGEERQDANLESLSGKAPESTSQEESVTSPPSDQEYNFRQLRESKEQLERKVADLEREMYSSRRKEPEPEPEQDSLRDDDLVEGKHLRKMLKEIDRRLKQRELDQLPDQMRGRFPDYEQVVTHERIERLKKEEPELYATFSDPNQNPRNVAVAVYRHLKAREKGTTEASRKLQANAKKPRSPQEAEAGSSPLHEANAFANGLTPELQQRLWKEMEECASRF